jgi:hypothetical protein
VNSAALAAGGSRRAHAWFLVALLMLSVWLTSCGDGPASESTAERCETSADCGALQVCRSGRCFRPAEDAGVGRYALRITPPSFRPELVERQVRDVPVGDDGTLPPFVLNRPVRVIGSLSYVQDSTPLIADLRWRNTDGVPGQEFAANTTSAAQSGAFSLELPAGYYDVTIVPQFATMPRYDVRNVLMNDDGTSVCSGDPTAFCQAWSYALIPPSEHLAIRGRVTRRRESATVPASGVTVYAVNADRTVESAESLTDESGDFIVFLPPRDDLWTFSVRASDDWAAGTTVTWEPLTILRDAPPDSLLLSMESLGDTVGLRLEPQPSPPAGSGPVAVVRGEASLDPQVAARANPRIASALVRLQYSANDLEVNGSLLTRVLPGRFDVSFLLTSGDGGFASPRAVDVQPGEPDDSELEQVVELELEPPAELTLTVVQSEAAPLADRLMVELTPLRLAGRDSTELGPAQALFRRSLTGLTMPLSTLLPAGDYRADVMTASAASTTRSSYLLTVPSSGLTATLTLPDFTLVRGRLVGPEGAPLAGATVEAWDMRSLDQRAAPTATATTDVDGRYDLVVPSQSWNDAAHGFE